MFKFVVCFLPGTLKVIHNMLNLVYIWLNFVNCRYVKGISLGQNLQFQFPLLLSTETSFFWLHFIHLIVYCMNQQSRALGMIRSHVLTVLKGASAQASLNTSLICRWITQTLISLRNESSFLHLGCFVPPDPGSYPSQCQWEIHCCRGCRDIYYICPFQGSCNRGTATHYKPL